MKQLYSSVKINFLWWFNYFLLTLLMRNDKKYGIKEYELEKWGSPYGGWYIPFKLLRKGWVYYLAGVGNDITFDLALVKRIGCKVFLFDPTHSSIDYMNDFVKNKKIQFYPYGIWSEDKVMNFNKPNDTGRKSYSIVDIERTNIKAFSAQCKRLQTIMKELKHNEIDLLKIDIEGAEYAVLNDMFNTGIKPKVLLVEFDQPVFVLKTHKAINQIFENGYSLAIRDMWNFTFIKE